MNIVLYKIFKQSRTLLQPCFSSVRLVPLFSEITATYLAYYILISDADNHTILGSIVLVLVLNNQETAGVIVRLALATTLEFDLVTLEISFVLDNLNEPL